MQHHTKRVGTELMSEYYIEHLRKQKRALANRYSVLGRHHNSLNNYIRRNLSLLPSGSKILDSGCGLSIWVTPAIRKKYKLISVDGETSAIEACKKVYKNSDYRLGDLYNLKFKPEQFDAVVMREVIEHFRTPEKAVKEVYGVLKLGGIYILTTPNYDSFLLRVIEQTYNRFFGGPCKPYLDDVHPSNFKPHTLGKLLKKYFIVDELTTLDMGISLACVARKR